MGLPYATGPLSPLYAPVDEDHPNIGTDPYALSKEVDERDGRDDASSHGFQVVAFRIPATAPMAVHVERQQQVARDPGYLSNELWAYLDVRDAARAFGLAVERDIPGFHVINVMALDTYSALPTAELMARSHPSTPLRRPLVGRESVFDTTRSRELLGFVAQHRLEFEDEADGSVAQRAQVRPVGEAAGIRVRVAVPRELGRHPAVVAGRAEGRQHLGPVDAPRPLAQDAVLAVAPSP